MIRRSEIAPGAVLEVRVYEPEARPEVSAKNAAAIAYLKQQIAEEATNNSEEIRKADAEVNELMGNLNRVDSGEMSLIL